MYKNNPEAFTLWLNEGKNTPTPTETPTGKAEERGMKTGKAGNERVCICSPTTHYGSFKCKYHRAVPNPNKCSSPNSNPSNVPIKSQPKLQELDRNTNNKSPRLSRFGRAAFDDMSLKVK